MALLRRTAGGATVPVANAANVPKRSRRHRAPTAGYYPAFGDPVHRTPSASVVEATFAGVALLATGQPKLPRTRQGLAWHGKAWASRGEPKGSPFLFLACIPS